MKKQSGQALTETILVTPVLILGGILAIEASRIISEKSLLKCFASERAYALSASELQWVNLKSLSQQQIEGNLKAGARLYATHHTGKNPGVSVQINACVPLLIGLRNNAKQLNSQNPTHRNCLGMFEGVSSFSLLRSGMVRIRVSAFAPRHASYDLFHHGIEIPENFK